MSFEVATGKHQKRINEYRLVITGQAPFMVAEKAGRLYQINFTGNEIKAYPPIDAPYNGGTVLADGTLFLPGGPGVTFFRKYSPEGKLLLANGEPFTALIAKLPEAQAKAGDTLIFSAKLLDAQKYYEGSNANGTLYAFGRSLITPEAWRRLTLAVVDGQTQVSLPTDIDGPYQVRLASQPSPDAVISADFKLRIPGSGEGTVTAFTPRNRRNFQQGETIRLHIVVRARVPITGELTATLASIRGTTAFTTKMPLTLEANDTQTINLALPAATTQLLLPGEYRLEARLGTLHSYPAQINLVTAVAETISQRLFVWDSDFFADDWNYPLTRGEMISWMGGNTLIRDMQYSLPLSANSEQGDANLLRGDQTLPAPELAFKPGQWQTFLDNGLPSGLGLMPLQQTTWEAYTVLRDNAQLAKDARQIQLTAQSLSQYPNFRGLDFKHYQLLHARL